MRTLEEYRARKYYKAPFFAAPGAISTIFGYGSFESEHTVEPRYALVDLETNSGAPGDNAGGAIEIAIVVIDEKGVIQDRYCTLLKPENGDVGMTSLHGITGELVRDAPTFSDVAGKIIEMFDRAIVVAHNAKFEEGFLNAEFKRAGIKLPPLPALDSMWLAQMELDLYNYKLGTVVDYYGEEIRDAHSAMGDVLAMAMFMPKLLASAAELTFPVKYPSLPIIPYTDYVIDRSEHLY